MPFNMKVVFLDKIHNLAAKVPADTVGQRVFKGFN
jgi:hypothetical protein